mgnify:CR=1 FL=1
MLKDQLKIRSKLIELQKKYPLALAKLWVPHCHRWKGEGSKSKRAKGCGQPMRRLGGNTWTCAKCDITEQRTSQKDPFIDMGEEATAVFGGNRAGKTELAAMFAVAVAAGSGEWWVREWLKNNNLPKDLIKAKPGIVIASALSYNDALGYVRPKLSKFLPVGTTLKGWKNTGQATAYLPNGGKIISFSADSGRKRYQGIAADLCWLDEEHPKGIMEECLLRVIDTKGRCLLSMTPLLGLTWPNELFILAGQSKSFKYHKISGLDNPWVSSVKMRKAVSHLSEAAQASRLYGDFANQTGLVYPELNRSLHVVEPFEIPKHWKRYRAIDFGVVNPFSCICLAHDQDNDDVLYVFAEYYATEKTTIQNGHAVRRLFAKHEPFDHTICDNNSKDGRMLLARHCGISNRPAPKHLGIINTINLVKNRLAPDAEGKPHLKIFSTCKQLLKEFSLYSWAKNSTGQDAVRKQHDHGLDALRYAVAFIYRLHRHL